MLKTFRHFAAETEECYDSVSWFKYDFLGGTPIVQAYEFDEKILTDGSMKVKIFEYYSVEWAEFIWNNRDEKQNCQ